MMGSPLFERAMAYDYMDAERAALMRKVWAETPFMVNVFTGQIGEELDREIRDWCEERWGDEYLPLHGRPGRWQRGGVTLFGWTWFGFETGEMMTEFQARWKTSDEDPPQ